MKVQELKQQILKIQMVLQGEEKLLVMSSCLSVSASEKNSVSCEGSPSWQAADCCIALEAQACYFDHLKASVYPVLYSENLTVRLQRW